jgi:hypothetical protein
MSKSEIFDSFVKIAQEQGLLSDGPEHTEKDFHETNPRHDSYTIEQIGKLYNTKPAQPKDMEYKKNIMEDAHPDPVVLFMAHDKLNALIENENEGQNARIRITLKEPDGHLTQRKYAEKELVMSLVRLANALDNDGKEELRKLADVCLVQATSKKKDLIKQALIPQLLIGGLITVVGIIYAKEHLPNHTFGWTQDYATADNAIDEMINSHDSWGFGYTYKQELIDQLTQLKNILSDINTAVEAVQPALDEVQTPRTGPGITQELAELAKDPATQKADQAIKDLRANLHKNWPFVRQVIINFGSQSYKQRMIGEEGAVSSLIDSTGILHGASGLFHDKFDDVAAALVALKKDLDGLANDLNGVTNAQQKLQQQLTASQSEVDLPFQAEPTATNPTAAPAKPAAEPNAFEKALAPLEEELKGLSSGLIGP